MRLGHYLFTANVVFVMLLCFVAIVPMRAVEISCLC